MKALQITIFIFLLLVLGYACSSDSRMINTVQLQKRGDGLYYAVNEEKPYSGRVVEQDSSGQKSAEQTFKNGKLNGLSTAWYYGGQKKEQIGFNNGQKSGAYHIWYENGQKKKEGAYKSGKEDGKWSFWYENGQKKKEGAYKSGKEDGKWAYWMKNGEKMETGTMTGNNGKKYQTVMIGNQWWVTENLRETEYRDGSVIPKVTSKSKWTNLKTGAYCAYDNKESNADKYGYLYNWFAVNDSRNIAPSGWHVATDEEWQNLIDYLGGPSVAGGKIKEAGTSHWSSPNSGATNESGFSALPGGHRTGFGGCLYLGNLAQFWSSEERRGGYAWARFLDRFNSGVERRIDSRRSGLSVRLIRD